VQPAAPHPDRKESGHQPGGGINAFHTDTKAEIALCAAWPSRPAPGLPCPQHWRLGGEGALELADAVLDACEERNNFVSSTSWTCRLRQRVERIAKEVYGADGVSYHPVAEQKAKQLRSRSESIVITPP
jgi:formyltetrahydrofolate synthetase